MIDRDILYTEKIQMLYGNRMNAGGEINSAVDKMIAFGKEQNKQAIVKTAEFIRDFDLENDLLIKARYEDLKWQLKKAIPRKNIDQIENWQEKVRRGSGDFLTDIYYADTEVIGRLPKLASKIEAEIDKGKIKDPDILTWAKDYLYRLKEFLPIAIKFEKMKERIGKKEITKEQREEQKRQELYKKIYASMPLVNAEILSKMVEDIKNSFKPLEEIIYNKEMSRYEALIKTYLSKEEAKQKDLHDEIRFYDRIFNIAEIKERWEKYFVRTKYHGSVEREERIQYVSGLTLKDGWQSALSEEVHSYIESLRAQLIYAIVSNFEKITEPIDNYELLNLEVGGKGFEGSFKFNFKNGSSFIFKAQAIGAGGYNIQRYHLRYLTHFVDVILSDGTKISNPYLSQVIQYFSASDKMADGGKILLAPNGKPSNLSEAQWNLVRSHDFRMWFGDWMNEGFINKILDSKKSVEVIQDSIRSGIKAERKLIKKLLRKDVLIGGKIKAYVGKEFYEHTVRHALQDEVYFSMSFIEDICGQSILFDTGKNTKTENKPHANSYEYYLCPVIFNGEEFIARVTVEVDMEEGRILYDMNVIKKEAIRKTIREKQSSRILDGLKSLVEVSEYKDRKILLLTRTLSKNISKVIDDNGEPLIMYHGSNQKFNKFSDKTSKYEGWHFFASDFDDALNFAENKGGNIVRPFFLNAKNPAKGNLQYMIQKGLLDKDKNDSAIQGSINWVVVASSSQAKLANGTNTTFDSDNHDIRYGAGGGVAEKLGISKDEAKNIFHLPYEIAVYVPSTKGVSENISKEEWDERIEQVKKVLAKMFGGFSASDVEGGYVSTKEELVKEGIIKVTSFSTRESFEENKEKLIQQISDWSKQWGQEAIGFEFEGDLMYVPEKLANGGELLYGGLIEGVNSKDFQIAQQMRANGFSPEAIWGKAMWYFNEKDSMWRTEIPDNDYRFKLSLNEIYADYFLLSKPILLSDLIEHKLLFEMMPLIRNFIVIFKEYREDDIFGSYDYEKTFTLYINFKYYEKYKKEYFAPNSGFGKEHTLLAEIQYCLQGRFRYAKDKGYKEATKRVNQRAEQRRRELGVFLSKKDWIRADKIKRDIKIIEDNFKSLVWYEYIEQLGEIESRDVLYRMNFSKEERKRNLPLTIALDKHYVNFDDTKVFFAEGGELIGTGSAREVYDIGSGKVKKVAYNEKGIEQNKNEAEINDGAQEMLPKIFDHSKDYKWIITERAKPATEEDMWKHFNGFSFWDIEYYIWNKQKQGDKKHKIILSDSFVKQLIELKEKHGLDIKDLSNYKNYGFIGNELKLLDYGMKEKTREKLYADGGVTEENKLVKVQIKTYSSDEYIDIEVSDYLPSNEVINVVRHHYPDYIYFWHKKGTYKNPDCNKSKVEELLRRAGLRFDWLTPVRFMSDPAKRFDIKKYESYPELKGNCWQLYIQQEKTSAKRVVRIGDTYYHLTTGKAVIQPESSKDPRYLVDLLQNGEFFQRVVKPSYYLAYQEGEKWKGLAVGNDYAIQ